MIPPTLYIKPNTQLDDSCVLGVINKGNLVKTLSLRTWAGQRCRADISDMTFDASFEFQLLQLQPAPALLDELPLMPLTIHTQHLPTKLMAQEIALEHLSIGQIWPGVSREHSQLAIQWALPKPLNNQEIQVTYERWGGGPADPWVGRAAAHYTNLDGEPEFYFPMGSAYLYLPVQYQYAFGRAQVRMRIGDDFVPLLDQDPNSDAHPPENTEIYPDSRTLFLSPLPENIVTINLQ